MDTNIRREQRAGLIATARGIVDGADAETRSLTSEEQQQIDRVFADADALQRTIEREDKLATAESELRSFHRRTVSDPATESAPATEARMTARPEYRAAFSHWMRTGDRTELRALEVGVAGEGGNIVDDSMAAAIVNKADEMSFVRGLSNVMASSSDVKIPIEATRVAAVVKAEEAAYAETDPAYGQITLSSHKLTTLVKVSEELLYDAEFDLQGWLSTSFGRAFGLGEDKLFLTGSGTGEPTGVINEGGVGNVTAAAQAAITADELITAFHTMPPEYRNAGNVAWVMNDSTAKLLRQLKDGNNQYIWQPGLQAGTPDMLMGKAVYTNSNIPAAATGNIAAALVNFDYFTIVDRGRVAVQRLDELFAGNGQIGYRAYSRLDGRLTQDAACATITMA
tara:strand:+ start:780 stop:1967 length:1188 start_codon:yes stop_codon:yes gene_type:complete